MPGPDDTSHSGLTLSTQRTPDRVLLTAAGQLDIATAPLLREHLVDIFVRGTPGHLIVDLAEVEYADSTGLGVLVGARRRVSADSGRMTVVANDRVRRVMELSGLNQLWTVVGDVRDVPDDDRAP